MATPPTEALTAAQLQLLDAASAGHLPLFKRVASQLDGGKGRLRETVEAVRVSGAGVLHLAAGKGRVPVCRCLVEELQVDIDATDERGRTPLTHAILCGSYGAMDTVSYLLDHGANPDKCGEQGCPPLHAAATQGKCEIVKALITKGADVDLLSHCGTPLYAAALYKQDGAMKILLDHHADCNKAMHADCTPLIGALEVRSLECVKLLLKAGADVKGGGGGNPPLYIAAIKGLTDFYKCLLEAGADPNEPDDFGQLPIEVAALKNRRRDVEILLLVTSRIPSVHDWSVDGIFDYVESKMEDEPVYKIKPEDLRLEGNKAYKGKDYFTAIKIYSRAANGYPEDATLYSNRSICWLNMNEGQKALIDAQLCRMLRPNWPKACYREGAAHMLLKDYEKACDAFRDGLKLGPGNVEIEKALRKASKSLELSHAAKKGH